MSEVRRVMRNNDGVVTTPKKFLRTVGLGIAQGDTNKRTDLHFRVTSHSVKKDKSKRVVVVNQSRKSIIHNIFTVPLQFTPLHRQSQEHVSFLVLHLLHNMDRVQTGTIVKP